MKNRELLLRLRRRGAGKLGRLLVLTGARQTGKTTLARQTFPDMPYISLEDPVSVSSWTALSAADWIRRYPRAILDEVQKAPAVVETIRAAYDADPKVRYVLLGSSQILLLSKIRESMAGRAAIEELWPLTLPEMLTEDWSEPVVESRLVRWLREGPDDILAGVPSASRAYSAASEAFERYLRLGGMPVVHDPEVTPEEKLSWLSDYQKTYLERDVADLAALRELEPFVRAQKALALRSGGLVNFSDLARDAGVAPGTARRFLRYLELSYQVLALPAWHANASKRLTKRPKVHLVDPGVQRSILGRSGEVTGDEFESAVVAEIFKQVRTAGLRVALHHLRTHDGREVDLLIESDRWVVAIEVKMARTVAAVHARNLTSLEAILGRPVRKGIVLSRDPVVRELSPEVIALPAAWALGPCCEQVRRRATPIPRRHRRLPHP